VVSREYPWRLRLLRRRTVSMTIQEDVGGSTRWWRGPVAPAPVLFPSSRAPAGPMVRGPSLRSGSRPAPRELIAQANPFCEAPAEHASQSGGQQEGSRVPNRGRPKGAAPRAPASANSQRRPPRREDESRPQAVWTTATSRPGIIVRRDESHGNGPEEIPALLVIEKRGVAGPALRTINCPGSRVAAHQNRMESRQHER